jgi:hypothetical protein
MPAVGRFEPAIGGSGSRPGVAGAQPAARFTGSGGVPRLPAGELERVRDEHDTHQAPSSRQCAWNCDYPRAMTEVREPVGFPQPLAAVAHAGPALEQIGLAQ